MIDNDQLYDIKHDHIVEWFGKRWNLNDEIDCYYLYNHLQHNYYRANQTNRDLLKAYYRVSQGDTTPYPTGFNYHDNKADKLIISVGVEPPKLEGVNYLNIKEGFELPIMNYPNCLVNDFDTTLHGLESIVREKFPQFYHNCEPEKVVIYAAEMYAGAGIALAGWSGYNNCYIEHGQNTYSWRTNPHCVRHRKAKAKGWIYNPEWGHKMTILRCYRLRHVVSQITDPIRHLDDWPELRITYAMQPEQPSLELYQDYLWDYKTEQIQVVKPDFKKFLTNV